MARKLKRFWILEFDEKVGEEVILYSTDCEPWVNLLFIELRKAFNPGVNFTLIDLENDV
jgi:hypothetical protein